MQGFRWAVDNDKWQARVDSIKPLFEGIITLNNLDMACYTSFFHLERFRSGSKDFWSPQQCFS